MSHTDLRSAPAGVLRAAAGEMVGSESAHWSRVALVLARVEDEGLYAEWGYSSARAWATDELGLTPSDYVGLLKLWRMVQKAPSVSIFAWALVPKSRAAQIVKVAAMGGNIAEWVTLSNATTPADFNAAVRKALGKPQEWVTFKVSMPAELAELAEAALVMALPRALDDEPNPDKSKAKDRDVRFRCLEVILTEWVQQNAVQLS